MMAKYSEHRQTIAYLFFGGLTTLVNWGCYSLIIACTQGNTNAANVLSWCAAVCFAFITNKRMVFRSLSWNRETLRSEASAFLGARLLTGALEIIGLPLLLSWGLDQPLFDIEGFAAKMLLGIIVVLLNYLLSKIYVFKK